MRKKILKLAEKEGFILLLFLCVCLVAGGTIYLSTRNLNTSKKGSVDKDLVILEEQNVSELEGYEMDPMESVVDESITKVEEIQDDLATKEAKEIEEVEADDLVVLASAEDGYTEKEEELEFVEPEEEEDVETIKTVEKPKNMILPTEGSVVTEYTKDALMYSNTLESWISHKAIDIGAKEGTVVVAAMDGVIKEVYEDELWGIVIVIDHGDKLETRYSNLSTKEMVKVGLNIKQGDHISKVGKTAKIEMLMEPHLHFEMIKDGKIIDPRSISN